MASPQPVVPSGLVTSEQLERIVGSGPCDLVEGRIVRLPPTGGEHGRIEGRLYAWLDAFVAPRGLGQVLVGEVGIVTRRDPDTVRGADVLFISTERYARLSRPSGYLDVPPELVVEILSPWDKPSDVVVKLRDYFAAGVDAVWVVDPQTRTVRIHRSADDFRTLTVRDTLTAEGPLDGFSVPVARLFE